MDVLMTHTIRVFRWFSGLDLIRGENRARLGIQLFVIALAVFGLIESASSVWTEHNPTFLLGIVFFLLLPRLSGTVHKLLSHWP
jgi:hypothetical protein